MQNILLVCAAGMSTSMLVKRMLEQAEILRLRLISMRWPFLKLKKN